MILGKRVYIYVMNATQQKSLDEVQKVILKNKSSMWAANFDLLNSVVIVKTIDDHEKVKTELEALGLNVEETDENVFEIIIGL